MLTSEELLKIKKALKRVEKTQQKIRNTFKKESMKGWVYKPDPRELERMFQTKVLEKRLGKQKWLCMRIKA